MATAGPPGPGWGRRRLLGVLAATVALVAALLAGLGYLVVDAVHGHAEKATLPLGLVEAPTTARERRDAGAAAAMLAVDAAAARGGTPTAHVADPLQVPPASAAGQAGVPAGFPHTPAGAVGQLAAIDTTVLTAMSMDTTRAVHQSWALPGAPSVGEWVMTQNVQAFLTAAGSAVTDTAPVPVAVAPVAGQVKGVDGPDWTVACVLLRVQVTLARTAAMAYGHCERMAWTGGRWQVAPGTQPAKAPSTWPGTDLARKAGWRPWTEATQAGGDGDAQ